jgi:Reverse transcriptase (RNA-dependent DNA polymerase).
VDTLDLLGQCKIFTVLDMASGYLQIEIEEKDREKTAFSTPQGHFHFNKMCFELMNAPATYQRCMDSILLGQRGGDCLCYLDDLILFSPDVATHVEKLQRVFDRFKIQPVCD